MAEASRTVVITVNTQRGTKDQARHVLQDVIDSLRGDHVTYMSVGRVTVTVTRAKR